MTNEQAIDVLNMVEAHGLADEAKKLAIKALQNDRPHGTWDKKKIYGTCSVCGEYAPETEEGFYFSNFCPNCGADMRGKEE